MYSITIKRDALRSLSAIPNKDAERIANAIDKLAENARPNGSVKMKSSGDFDRIKIGNYRVIYEINDGDLLILVVEIGHRKEVYKKK